MINVLINGCNGKMGQVLAEQIKNNNEFKCILGIDRTNSIENTFPVYVDTANIKELPDVIIDFCIPEATFKILEFAKQNSIPTVIATTGFSENQTEKIKEYAKFIPIFKSANMSYEVNLMAKLVADLAVKLPNSDIEIIDAHHNNKIDSPSGTALILADSINSALNNEMVYEYNRHAKKEKRGDKEIGIHSIRGGTEVGKHTVLFLGENESFEITHNITSRCIFANGALKAAEFILKQPSGFYDMNDILRDTF